MSLSISAAWDETAALARRESWRLFGLAFLLLSLPSAVLRALAPVTMPGHLPHAGLWLIGVPVLVAASLVGALTISALALGSAPRAALGTALRRILPLFGAALLVLLGVAVLTIMFGLIVGAAPAAAGPAFFVAMAILLFFWARLLLLTPAAAAENVGPVRLIRRSWELSRGRLWRLFGFLLVVLAVSLVVLIAASVIGGLLVTLLAGRPVPGSPAMLLILLVSALVQAVISGLFTAFVARLYAQCVGAG
jgi:hypothetical protein